jgi:hypothetical protein
LEQASELLGAGYITAAAVIAGAVLETYFRQLCNDRDIEIGNLNMMNADSAKRGVLRKHDQKQITARADIRNNAANGRAKEFNKRRSRR